MMLCPFTLFSRSICVLLVTLAGSRNKRDLGSGARRFSEGSKLIGVAVLRNACL